MLNRFIAAVLAAIILAAAPVHAAETRVEQLVATARGLAAQGNLNDALTVSAMALDEDPGNFSALYYAVAIAKAAGKPGVIAAKLDKLGPSLPDSKRFGLKQAQLEAYYAAQDADEVARIRGEIIDLWRNSPDAQIKGQTVFVRENITVERNLIVLATEALELRGPRAIRYKFTALQGNDRPVRVVTLGSYDFTTKVAKEIENKPADWRMWHLDAYEPDGRHATLGMFGDGEPSYDAARATAIAWFKGEFSAMSSSKPAPKP